MVRQMPCTAHTTGLPQRRPLQPERIDRAVGQRHLAGGERAGPLGEVEPAGEVGAARVQDAAAQLVVAIELGPGEAERAVHPEVEGVALLSGRSRPTTSTWPRRSTLT